MAETPTDTWKDVYAQLHQGDIGTHTLRRNIALELDRALAAERAQRDKEADERQQRMNEALDRLIREKDELSRQNSELRAERAQHQQEQQAADAEIEACRKEIARLTQEPFRLTQEKTAQAETIRQLQAQIENMQHTIDDRRVGAKNAEAEITRLEARCATLTQERDEANDLLDRQRHCDLCGLCHEPSQYHDGDKSGWAECFYCAKRKEAEARCATLRAALEEISQMLDCPGGHRPAKPPCEACGHEVQPVWCAGCIARAALSAVKP